MSWRIIYSHAFRNFDRQISLLCGFYDTESGDVNLYGKKEFLVGNITFQENLILKLR